MNKVIEMLLLQQLSELIANGQCIQVDYTKYFLQDGVLCKLNNWSSQPEWVTKFDNGSTEEAVIKFIKYLSELKDIDECKIVNTPTQQIQTFWS